MAYFKITQNKKGELQAKIQVSGKDLSTGKSKVFTKRVYNTDELTEAKFRKQVEKTAIAFEEEVSRAYQDGKTQLRSKVLTFSELMQEWKANIKAGLSVNYYERAEKVEKIFGEFLEQNGLADKPISVITVRDVQRFLSSFTLSGYKSAPKARLKKPLPKQVNFRLMARENVIDRCVSYNLNKKGANIAKETAETLCDRCGLDYGQWLTFYERKWDMKHVTCHGLRHTYCSLLLAQNVPIQTVSKYMGHSDSTVTLKVYSHFIPEAIRPSL